MKVSALARTVALVAGLGASAHPGLSKLVEDLQLVKATDAPELLGDLIDLPDSQLSSVGKSVKAILFGGGSAQDLASRMGQVPPMDSPACAEDTCCIWKYIADDMAAAMTGSAGRCNAIARMAIRLAFHDAGTWSKSTGTGGGADGSIILAGECETRKANRGLGPVCEQMRAWYDKYKGFGVSMADMVQVSANVATVVCPLGPRIRTYVGRVDNSAPSPEGLLPGPKASADDIIRLFGDKTISPAGIVALLGAHTTSQQSNVDPNRKGDPQDSTPGVWDTRYFQETVDPNAPKRVMKLQSDINIARDPRTSGVWQSFSSPILGQLSWNQAYSREAVRLSLLGVYNINSLTDCTGILPTMRDTFRNQDESLLEEWLNGGRDDAGPILENGDEIPA